MTLITDGMRSVRAFHFDKAAASVLTTCVSLNAKHDGKSELLFHTPCHIVLKDVIKSFFFVQMVTMELGFLFLGSRLGNSLLLRYTEKLQENATDDGKEKERDKEKDKQVIIQLHVPHTLCTTEAT